MTEVTIHVDADGQKQASKLLNEIEEIEDVHNAALLPEEER